MAQETWLVIAVGAAFLLLGVAVSPLGWVALLQRRGRADRDRERLFDELSGQIRALKARLERCEDALQPRREPAGSLERFAPPGSRAPRPPAPIGKGAPGRRGGPPAVDIVEPRLIAVPDLSAAHDRQAMHSGLQQRYAAIWDLADSGSAPDVIARATGLPIGQVELILGLRRQLDGTRTNIPHASHE